MRVVEAFMTFNSDMNDVK